MKNIKKDVILYFILTIIYFKIFCDYFNKKTSKYESMAKEYKFFFIFGISGCQLVIDSNHTLLSWYKNLFSLSFLESSIKYVFKSQSYLIRNDVNDFFYSDINAYYDVKNLILLH